MPLYTLQGMGPIYLDKFSLAWEAGKGGGEGDT